MIVSQFVLRWHRTQPSDMYGLFAHKLAHFFDVVHGTRHDFFMNEYKIGCLSNWLTLLRAKGWEPADLETGPNGDRFLKAVVI